MVAGDVKITSLAVATLFGIVLNLILPQKLPGDNTNDNEEERNSSNEIKEGENEDFESERSIDENDESSSSIEKNTVQDVKNSLDA